MKSIRFLLILTGLLIAVLVGILWPSERASSPEISLAAPPDVALQGYFIAGDEGASYRTFGSQPAMRFSAAEIISALLGDRVSMHFIGANPEAQLRGSHALEARAHDYRGNDPAAWQTDLPMYTQLTYHELYAGIDLAYTFQGTRLKSEFVVRPGASLAQIQVKYTGIDSLSLTDDGQTLRVTLPSGEVLYEHIPAAYQEIDGRAQAVVIAFKLLDATTYTFEAREPLDPTQTLVIDPVLLYASYFGGSLDDEGWSIALDQEGNTYISGITHSADFPHTPAGQFAGDTDVFVVKLDPTGAVSYVTMFGGSSGEQGNGIVVDANGAAYIAGQTTSTDFPLQNAWQPDFAGFEDAYLLKLDAAGKLAYATYIGGTRGEEVNDIHVDDQGRVYLGGEVYSDDFPLVNPWRSAAYGSDEEDAFISIFDAQGVLIYSTLISAPHRDQIFRIGRTGECRRLRVGNGDGLFTDRFIP